MTTASRLSSLAVLVFATGVFCTGCEDVEAVLVLSVMPMAEQGAGTATATVPQPCRTAAAQSTQTGCRPMPAPAN